MKKTLLLLASAALLLVGCAKEQIGVGEKEGGITDVTFTASLESGVATKADIDTDGKGWNANRCIMEIYYGDALYKRLVEPLTGNLSEGPLKATFTNVPVVAGKTYRILFWADHVDNAETAAGLAVDKYYDTDTQNGLKSVKILGKTAAEDFLDEPITFDYLDAFCFSSDYTVPQGGKNFTDIKLTRPFAQLNVITTDVGEGKTVTSADLLPETVWVSYKAANIINVATGEVSGTETFTYEAPVYGNWGTVAANHELTLSMDYILASTEQGAVDVTFKTKNGETVVMNHALTNLPYKRNYRTNVKGDLLTTNGSWTAEIDPIWSSPDIVKVVEVADIQSANDIIEQYAETTDHLEVKFTAEPNDSGKPGTDENAKAILTTPVKENGTLSIEVLADTKQLYVGDYESETDISSVDEDAKHAVVNINVPQSSSIVALVINAPSKSVYINGKQVASVGTITSLDAITSQNTLIIEKDQTIGTLTIRQGGLEIHGTVNKATVPEEHGTIAVRDCENLNEELVYNVLKDHIAEGYVGVKGRTTADKWDIIPAVCKIGTKSYGSLVDAVAAVQSGETINLVRDYEGDGVVVPGGKNFTLDFGGYTYKVIGNLAGSAGTQNQCFQLLQGSTLTFQNGTITTSCAKLGINTYSNLTIKDVTIDMSQTEATGQVACLETCNGTVSVEGASNLIVKEGQIATLVLYWPNGGYGDINLTMNTTGEVSGLMAYGSYQVQDLSTVAQHSHVAIKNGKYDVAFDMDGLEKYNYKVTGGVFTAKPDYNFTAKGTAFVPNTDAATKDKYPWKIGTKPLPGAGTESDPYQVASAEDLYTIMNYTSASTHFELTQDLELTKADCSVSTSNGEKAITGYIYGTFDGGGHKITFPNDDNCYTVASYMRGGTIKNLDIEFKEDGVVAFQNYSGATFDNVNVSGKLLHFTGNRGAYIIQNWDNLVMENCTCSADITGKGGHDDYNAVFIGYDKCGQYGGAMTFKNCKYTGKMVCGRSAMFIGNPNVGSVNLTVENCSNDGSITSTYVADGYKMNYYYGITSNNTGHFTLNGVSHPGVASDQSWVPTCSEDELVKTNGTTMNGPVDCGMAITKNGENQFVITPATDGAIGGTTVAKYTVYSGLYVGVTDGSSRFFATEDIIPYGSASYTTTMKDLQFVDDAFVNGGDVETVGDNRIFTKDNVSYYVVESDESTGGQPKLATIHYVAAYDSEGRLLASVSME